MVTVIGHIPGHIAYLALFVWSTYWSLSISVVADTDNIKDVLEVIEVSGLMVIWWKQAHPSDTEDEANVSLTSKDKVEEREHQPGVACRGLPACQPPQGATVTAAGGEASRQRRSNFSCPLG